MIITGGLGSPLLVTRGYGAALVAAELVPPFTVRFRTLPAPSRTQAATLEVVVITSDGATVLSTPVAASDMTTVRLRALVAAALNRAGFEAPTGSLMAATVKLDGRLETPPGSTTFGT